MSIEQFIQQNRQAFDTEMPGSNVWGAIETQLPKNNKPAQGWSIWRSSKLTSIAASLALLLVGTAIGMQLTRHNSENHFAQELEGTSPEFKEAADYYQRDINAKREKLAQFVHQKNAVETDIVQLEKVMEELKNELKDVPPARRQAIIVAMIENYKTRASILEKVLDKIEQQNTQQNEPTHI
jgi:predicted RNase H-like nuclease (RuvC/YqgF family)